MRRMVPWVCWARERVVRVGCVGVLKNMRWDGVTHCHSVH